MIIGTVPSKPLKVSGSLLKQNHSIKSLRDLKHGLNTISPDDWEELCGLLGVDKAIINDVKQLHRYNYEKQSACFNQFYNSGKATWENVVHAIASSPLKRVVLAKEIAWNYGIEYYTVMNQQNPTHSAQPDDHVIKKYQPLSDVVKYKLSSEDWEDICRLLDVDDATMVDLKRSSAYNHEKHTFCVRHFFNIGVVTWERVIRVIASDPLNRIVLAKDTAWDHGIDYYKVMNLKKPTHVAQPNDHVIKKYQDLYDVAYFKLPHEDWEDICRLLDVDDATVVNLKRSSAYDHEKHAFCVRHFFNIGTVATWEQLVHAMASEPLNQVALGKEIAQKYGFDFKAPIAGNSKTEL